MTTFKSCEERGDLDVKIAFCNHHVVYELVSAVRTSTCLIQPAVYALHGKAWLHALML